MSTIVIDENGRGFGEYTNHLDELIRKSDYVVNLLPSTPRTFHLLDEYVEERSNKVSNSSASILSGDQSPVPPVFINVGRGSIVSEEGLIRGMDNGIFSAAVLDVFETEPLPSSSKLWNRPDVIITPHVAAITTIDDV
eukprot:Awhi_evm1s15587